MGFRVAVPVAENVPYEDTVETNIVPSVDSAETDTKNVDNVSGSNPEPAPPRRRRRRAEQTE